NREALPVKSQLDLVSDVPGEKVEGAVGHVHDPNQSEVEGEATGDDEEGGCIRDRVQRDRDERTGVVDRRPEGGRAPAVATAGLRDEEDVSEREHDQRGREENGQLAQGQKRAELLASRDPGRQCAQPEPTLTGAFAPFKRGPTLATSGRAWPRPRRPPGGPCCRAGPSRPAWSRQACSRRASRPRRG